MRVIIAGSRSATSGDVRRALARCPWVHFVSVIVSGAAKGADTEGERWAKEMKLDVLQFLPDWKGLGRRAGPIRNREMAEAADGLIAVWDGKSRGTKDMVSQARSLGLRIFLHRTDINHDEDWPPTGIIEARWMVAEERAAILEYSGGHSRAVAEREAGRMVGTHWLQ